MLLGADELAQKNANQRALIAQQAAEINRLRDDKEALRQTLQHWRNCYWQTQAQEDVK